MKDFELIEHTADVALRVYGRDAQALFTNAAAGVFSLIVDPAACLPPPEGERRIALEAATLADLLVSWLSELISVFFAYKFLPLRYNITIDESSPSRLEARVEGREYDPYSQKINMEIKAATYHGLKIERTARGLQAEVILDV